MGESLGIALAIVLIIEGIGPMLFPNRWRQFLQQLTTQPAGQLRTYGGSMVVIGIVTLMFLL